MTPLYLTWIPTTPEKKSESEAAAMCASLRRIQLQWVTPPEECYEEWKAEDVTIPQLSTINDYY